MKIFRIAMIVLLTFLVLYLLKKRSLTEKCPSHKVEILLDSVFINQYRYEENFGPLFVYLHFTFKNNGNKVLSIAPYNLGTSINDRGKNCCYALYEGDTLYLMKEKEFNVSPDKIEEYTFLLGEPLSFFLSNSYDRLYTKYSNKFDNKVELIHNIVENSVFVFDFSGWKYIIDQSNHDSIIVRYLKPPEEGVIEMDNWPIP